MSYETFERMATSVIVMMETGLTFAEAYQLVIKTYELSPQQASIVLTLAHRQLENVKVA